MNTAVHALLGKADRRERRRGSLGSEETWAMTRARYICTPYSGPCYWWPWGCPRRASNLNCLMPSKVIHLVLELQCTYAQSDSDKPSGRQSDTPSDHISRGHERRKFAVWLEWCIEKAWFAAHWFLNSIYIFDGGWKGSHKRHSRKRKHRQSCEMTPEFTLSFFLSFLHGNLVDSGI